MLQIIDIPALESEGPRSQATLAYEVIRSDILNGRHLPERKLKIQELAVELDVSPGAVREALSRLVPEQLVVSRDQRGFVVAPLSIADLIDLTDLRCEIEAVALRRSVERADRDWEANILAAEHRLRGQVVVIGTDEPKLNPAWVQTHAAFHTALVSACGSRRLLALHAQLYEQSERYRGLSLHVEAPRNVSDEHSDIVKMALARDAENLIRTTIEHLRKTTALIVAAASKEAIVPSA
ncbi:GntR family transcriptional regulator [Sphingobium boeckii]|uniref:DNA-binding GntR family transcriptional regulator n=1 Tax=Sphingobium boeckii TaxID=1082345 RepID=A0A7W9AFV1_9SPHN|nr:FCD domain-containing protein [Sphingobium boeckii]MBB5684855.1 DNA-binding GntR family transcriptional regulator [Sphingobium boeckii]